MQSDILKDLYGCGHITLSDGISESRPRDTCNRTLSDINFVRRPLKPPFRVL